MLSRIEDWLLEKLMTPRKKPREKLLVTKCPACGHRCDDITTSFKTEVHNITAFGSTRQQLATAGGEWTTTYGPCGCVEQQAATPEHVTVLAGKPSCWEYVMVEDPDYWECW